jgi:tight adherence protein C
MDALLSAMLASGATAALIVAVSKGLRPPIVAAGEPGISLVPPPAARSRRRQLPPGAWAAVGAIAGLAAPMPLGLVCVPVCAAVGYRAPAAIAARLTKRRRALADAEVPQLLDLLAAASSAGLSAPFALARSADAVHGPLGDELRSLVAAVDLGARWRDELRALAERLELPDLRRTVAALTRTETLGASLATSTAELAARVRATRRAAITERARTAPVKMLFPLVFLVLPAFLLLTVVPVLLTTLQSIR